MAGPLGFPLVAGWCIVPAARSPFSFIMLPGGMVGVGDNVFFMIVTGWVAFTGLPPL
jgi:hypothetical protein